MEHFVYGTLITVIICLFLALWRLERQKRNKVSSMLNEIDQEEHRMIDFLHGLGKSLQEDSSPPNMHKYVVGGVAEVVKADAGILYLIDEARSRLVPVHMTDEEASVTDLPSELEGFKDPADRKSRLRSFLKLTAVDSNTGILGEALREGKAIHTQELLKHPTFTGKPNSIQEGMSVLVAPLIYAQKTVGVLAVTLKGDRKFTENDCDVFDSVAEQSACTLGSAIIHAEAGEKRRIDEELTRASEIQRILLPRNSPDLADFDLAAFYKPARMVSGDYYDYVRIDDDRFGIAIGDVCGKGIAASLIMAMSRSILRSYAPDNLSPASVLHAVNRAIFPDIREDMFVSFLYLVLERDSNEVTMARAGHELPLLYRRQENRIETLEAGGMAAGIDSGNVFKRTVKDFRFTMEKGDILILYTDGVNELEAVGGEEFGIERLEETILATGTENATEVLDRITSTLNTFTTGATQSDDITLIAIEKR
ncbi:SpoIIE family protein phosphatase [Verrucomicrobiales bacterium]|nr:SpoIIE family protein phosphatase [Verrucomicrobiales bacterium]MDC0314563.1 SpoIIE family protein phosphatase [bacterium]